MNTNPPPRPDPDTFEARLSAGLDRLADAPVHDPGEFDPESLLLSMPADRPRRMVPVLAAAAVAAVTVAGLVVLTPGAEAPAPGAQPDEPAPAAVLPPAEVEQPVEPAPAGALVFDDVADILPGATIRVESTEAGSIDPASPPVLIRRWYTATMVRPELGAAVSVDAFPSEMMAANVPADATSVSVQGVDAALYDDPMAAGRVVALTVDATTYVLTGTNLSDDELLLAAEHVGPAPDGDGAVVADAGLVNGLEERAAGTMFETTFLSHEALALESAVTHVESDAGTLWVRTIEEDASLLDLHRLGYETVIDSTVHGHPAFVTTIAGQPQYRGVTWHEGDVTYVVGSNGLTTEIVVELANRLRPATLDEWNELVDSSAVSVAGEAPGTTIVISDDAEG